MAIVIKARANDSTNDLIRKFKRASSATGIVQSARDRRYFIKPSQVRAQKEIQVNRLLRRARKLKLRKNVSKESLQKLYDRIQSRSF